MEVYYTVWSALADFFLYSLFLKSYCQGTFESIKKFPWKYDSGVLEYQINSAFIEKKIMTLKYRVI